MEHRSREQRRRETAARLFQSSAQLPTTSLARIPRLAATSIRSGVLALVVKVRRKPASASELESIHRIVESLGVLKGVAMKMGQHLSYVDSSLPDDVRAALAALQTHSQPMSSATVTAILHDELGPAAGPLVQSLEPVPIASASIGQVHRARLPDGTRVAVKVQYPGIARAIESDFGPASVAGRIAALRYPRAQLRGFVREARARVLDECDYRAEARHQTELATRFAGHLVITIPAVHPAYSTGRVLTTSLIDGVHLDELLAGDPDQSVRDRFGAALIEFYVGSLVRTGVLSGDPHPGNYLFTADGRIAMLDHGSTQRFATDDVRVARIARVLAADDRATAYRVSAELGADALLPLRVRFGLASVLERLGTHAGWRELVETHAAPAPPVAFEVVLVDPGERKIEIVREVRDVLGAGIREAKDLVEHAPRVVKRTADRAEAEALKRRLEISGGIVEIRTAGRDDAS